MNTSTWYSTQFNNIVATCLCTHYYTLLTISGIVLDIKVVQRKILQYHSLGIRIQTSIVYLLAQNEKQKTTMYIGTYLFRFSFSKLKKTWKCMFEAFLI